MMKPVTNLATRIPLKNAMGTSLPFSPSKIVKGKNMSNITSSTVNELHMRIYFDDMNSMIRTNFTTPSVMTAENNITVSKTINSQLNSKNPTPSSLFIKNK